MVPVLMQPTGCSVNRFKFRTARPLALPQCAVALSKFHIFPSGLMSPLSLIAFVESRLLIRSCCVNMVLGGRDARLSLSSAAPQPGTGERGHGAAGDPPVQKISYVPFQYCNCVTGLVVDRPALNSGREAAVGHHH